MRKYHFHITNKENAIPIMFEGIKAGEDGYIYLFEGKDVKTPNTLGEWVGVDEIIALDQLGLDEYVIFMVDTTVFILENDSVAEFVAPLHRRYKGNISPNRIKHLETRTAEKYIALLKRRTEEMMKMCN